MLYLTENVEKTDHDGVFYEKVVFDRFSLLRSADAER